MTILGILRNLSSAGLEARKKMRDVIGLIDSLLYVIRLSLGKPGADVKVSQPLALDLLKTNNLFLVR